MKTILSLVAFFVLISTASAQQFRYFDNRGNRFAGQQTPYGTVVVDPYGYRGYFQYYQTNRYWQPPVLVQPHYGVWQTPNPWYNYGW